MSTTTTIINFFLELVRKRHHSKLHDKTSVSPLLWPLHFTKTMYKFVLLWKILFYSIEFIYVECCKIILICANCGCKNNNQKQLTSPPEILFKQDKKAIGFTHLKTSMSILKSTAVLLHQLSKTFTISCWYVLYVFIYR